MREIRAYPPQCDEAVDVTLYDLHALGAGISPVAIHDEGHMLGNWTRFEHAEEDTLDAIDCFIPKPECVLLNRHSCGGHGNRSVRGGGDRISSSVVVVGVCAAHSHCRRGVAWSGVGLLLHPVALLLASITYSLTHKHTYILRSEVHVMVL